MTLTAVLLACGVFLIALRLSRLERFALDALASFRNGVAAMRNDALADDEKERIVQQSAIRLMTHFATITLVGAAVLAAPVGVLLALDALGVTSFQAAVDLSLRWEVITGTCIATFVVWLVRR